MLTPTTLSHSLLFLLFLPPLSLLASSTPLPTCLSPAKDTPLWTISDWSTDFTLPDGGAVIFRLYNTLTGYGSLCFRRGAFPEGQCIWVEGGTGEEDDTQTWFSYDEKVGELMVYQEWSCDGEIDSGRMRVKGEGMVSVQSECELEQEMPKGTMCWLQGASGVVYADRLDLGPT